MPCSCAAWFPGAFTLAGTTSAPPWLDAVVYPPNVPVYDGVDWYWGPSLTKAFRYLDRQRPTVVIFEWWTVPFCTRTCGWPGTRPDAARGSSWSGTKGRTSGEAALPGARRYVRTLMPRLLSLVDAHVVHSSFDLQAIPAAYPLGRRHRPRHAARSVRSRRPSAAVPG